VAHTRAWRAGHSPKPKFDRLGAFRHAREFEMDMPVGLVIPGREKYRPGAVRRWLDWMPRFKARNLRLGIVGGAIRGENLSELARMATFSPLGFTVVDTRRKRVAWLSERVPAQAGEKAFGLWGVRLRRIRDTSLAPEVSVHQATENLASVLRAARDLVRLEPRLKPWDPHFAQGLATLAGTGHEPASVDILPPRGYSEAAHRLVLAVRQTWVLGGVGSWTDTVPTDRALARAHTKITAELYACLIEGIVAAVNDGLNERDERTVAMVRSRLVRK
jgi:hypothetical protein